MAEKYRVLTGLSWGENKETGEFAKRAEPGEIRDDLNPQSIPWLIEAGHIEKVVAEPTGKGREAVK